MSSQAVRYETIIRVAEDDDRKAGDTLIEILKDVDARISRSEEQAYSIAEFEVALKTYGQDQIDLLLTPTYNLIKDKADLGAILSAESLSVVTLALGVQACVITPVTSRKAFAPSKYMMLAGLTSPDSQLIAELISYDDEDGVLTFDVKSFVGSGILSGVAIFPLAQPLPAKFLQVQPETEFTATTLQAALNQISTKIGGKLDAFATTVFGKSLVNTVDAADVRTLIGSAPAVHVHSIADITGLNTALTTKANAASAALTGTTTIVDATVGTSSASPFRVVKTGGTESLAIELKTPLTTSRYLGVNAGVLRFGSSINMAANAVVSIEGHVHAVADVTGLQALLDGKADLSHVHAIGNITGLQAALDAKAALAHTHAIADITSLQSALDGKAALTHAHGIADITSLSTTLASKANTASPTFTGTVLGSVINLNGTAAAPLKLQRTGTDHVGIEFANPTSGSSFLGVDGSTLKFGNSSVISSGTAISLVGHVHTIANITNLQSTLDGKQAVLGYVPENAANRGSAGGYVPLGGDGKVPSAYLPADGSYKGTWNAATNVPVIQSGVGNPGDFYFVGTAGTTTIDGISSWAAGDQIRFGAGTWQKVPNTNSVLSVAGKTGSVVLTSTDLTDSTVTGRSLFTASTVAAARTVLGMGSIALLNTIVDANVTAATLTNSKLANMAASTFKARVTNSTGSPEDITVSQAKTLLAIVPSDVSGLQALLDAKAAAVHAHAVADVTGLQALLDAKAPTASPVFTGVVTAAQQTIEAANAVPLTVSRTGAGDQLSIEFKTGVTGSRFLGFSGGVLMTHTAASVGSGKEVSLQGHIHAVSDVTGLQALLDGKAGVSHTHTIAQVTNLQASLDAKAAATHTHAMTDIGGLVAALEGKSSSAAPTFTGMATFDTAQAVSSSATPFRVQRIGQNDQVSIEYQTPTTGSMYLGFDGNTLKVGNNVNMAVGTAVSLAGHVHTIANVTGLQSALDAKFNASLVSSFIQTLLDDADAATARTTLGLGSISTLSATVLDGKANTTHTHAVSDVTGLQAALDSKAPIANATFTGTSSFDSIVAMGGLAVPLRLQRTGAGDQVSVEFATDITGSRYLGFANGILKVHTTASVVSGTAVSLDGHTHTIAQVTNLQSTLDGKINTSAAGATGLNILGAANVNEARATLGLGSLAYLSTIVDSNITNGTIQNSSLASVATATFKARSTTGTGPVQDLTVAQAKTLLAITQADVSGLVAALAGKASTTHTHAISDVTNLQSTLDGKAATVHAHSINDTTGLQAALNLKAPIDAPAFTGSLTAPDATIGASGSIPLTVFRGGSSNLVGMAFQTSVGTRYLGISADNVLRTHTSPGINFGKAISLEDHTHVVADVAGLQTLLDAKAPTIAPVFTGAATFATAIFSGGSSVPLRLNRTTGVDQMSIEYSTPVTGSMFLGFNGNILTVGSSANLSTGTAVSLVGHTHGIADVAGLQGAIESKLNVASPSFSSVMTGPSIELTTTTTSPLKMYKSGGSEIISIEYNTSVAGSRFLGFNNGVLMVHSTAALGAGTAISLAGHGHTVSDVTNLQTLLDGKAAATHTHAISDIVNLQTSLNGKADTSHTHAQADVTGLVTALAAKANVASPVFTGSGSIPVLAVGSSGSMPLNLSRSSSDTIGISFAGSTLTRYLGFVGGELQTGTSPSLGSTIAVLDSTKSVTQANSRVKSPTINEYNTTTTVSSPSMTNITGSMGYTSTTSTTSKILVMISITGNLVGNANAADDYTYSFQMTRYDGTAFVNVGAQQTFGDFNTGTIAASRQQNFVSTLRFLILDRSMTRSDNTNVWTLRMSGKPDYANMVLTSTNVTMTFMEFE